MVALRPRARNSRVIGPRVRDPMGRFCSSIKTTSFDWKKMELPYGLLTAPFLVRITSALNICPFWTREDPRFLWVCCDFSFRWARRFDRTLLTDTRIQSPTEAYFDLPKILIHLTVFAPELSATFKIVCIWIIFFGMLEFFLDFASLLPVLWGGSLAHELGGRRDQGHELRTGSATPSRPKGFPWCPKALGGAFSGKERTGETWGSYTNAENLDTWFPRV